jgi:hypothetical protein
MKYLRRLESDKRKKSTKIISIIYNSFHFVTQYFYNANNRLILSISFPKGDMKPLGLSRCYCFSIYRKYLPESQHTSDIASRKY